ncbi:MAG TPA: protein kinase [Anaerolineales bacterium]|nr:protein kinase [Anaerolineales bacterium]
MSFAIGENVGPYRILEQLGQGGMATVFKGYHAALDRYVAIKVLHPAFLQDPNFQARFQREARVVARLDHPNIVPIYDFAEHEGQPYLVMKFIEGMTLKARLGQAPLGIEEGLRIVEAAGAALAYAHKSGVLHRDIKPSNILLAPEGSIYLADFGLARMAQAGESTLSNDMMLGTPQYISPEQARGEGKLDEGSDIYSFGVVLYEMVVGKVPFSADTPFSIIHDHIYKPLPLPRSINPRVPEAVERVLLKALAKERSDRFQTVEGMVEAFRRAVRGEGAPDLAPTVVESERAAAGAAPAAAARPTTAEAAKPEGLAPRKSRGWMWSAGGAVLACLCLVAFLAAVRGRNQVAQAEPTATVRATALRELPPLTEARLRVKDHPADPAAHLALAEALHSDGEDKQAAESYLKASELFMDSGNMLEAANSGAQALALFGGPSEAPPRAVDTVTHALFIAAGDKAAMPLIDDLANKYPGWSLLPVLAARWATAAGDLEKSREWLDQAINVAPGDPLTRSALAEWDIASGNLDEGRRIAGQLMSQTRLEWLRAFLSALISSAG